MSAEPQQVSVYEAADGSCPYAKWYASLQDERAKQKIAARLDRLELGNFGDFKSLGGGVFEMRIDYGPGYRVYFGRDGHDLVILLCGGTKQRQSKDVATAKAYWEDYKKRKSETNHGTDA